MSMKASNWITDKEILGLLLRAPSSAHRSQMSATRTEVLAQYASTPELELQQRSASLFNLGQLTEGVLECMPHPELKATAMGSVKISRLGPAQAVIFLVAMVDNVSFPTTNGPTLGIQQDLLPDIFGSSGQTSSPASTGTTSPPLNSQLN
ncbi:hypothetical protein BDP27DRAFT_1419128 [Rhodocollybia butyracea]|uniref:Uncharacterized protein n=1 Tax=Rhodocollybia butyracea TaxID=206335 RepID=A0A9P5PY05_9AGAR|nr:hypothetical protein BDP27DRAFT_1419128 [Rhodocollybia butyracea]